MISGFPVNGSLGNGQERLDGARVGQWGEHGRSALGVTEGQRTAGVQCPRAHQRLLEGFVERGGAGGVGFVVGPSEQTPVLRGDQVQSCWVAANASTFLAAYAEDQDSIHREGSR